MTTNMNPLVSVVIPTYNHAYLLKDALHSVICQTYTNIEIIVIDNNSVDDTEEVVSSFLDPRIIFKKINNNGIIAASRNMGILAAKGDYVAFLDSDDIWHNNKIEKCMKKLSLGYDLVCHAETWFYEEDQKTRKVIYGPESHELFDRLLFEGNCLSTSAVMVNRKILEDTPFFSEDEKFITAEDYHLWLKLAKHNVRFGFLDQILGKCRIHEGNNSGFPIKNMMAVKSVFTDYYDKIKNPSLKIKILAWRRLAIIEYSGARGLQRNREHFRALITFIKAIARWPFIPKFYLAFLFNIFHLKL